MNCVYRLCLKVVETENAEGGMDVMTAQVWVMTDNVIVAHALYPE